MCVCVCVCVGARARARVCVCVGCIFYFFYCFKKYYVSIFIEKKSLFLCVLGFYFVVFIF